MVPMEIPNQRGIQDTPPRNPGALLGPVPLPVDKILVAPAAATYLQEAADCPSRMVVDDPGRRWRRSGRRKRAGGDRLELGDMEGRMDTERWRESETNGTGVDDRLHFERADEPGRDLRGDPLQGKILRPKPHRLSGSVLGGRQTAPICLQLGAGGCAEQCGACALPSAPAPAHMSLD
jgi:hypothetical protein